MKKIINVTLIFLSLTTFAHAASLFDQQIASGKWTVTKEENDTVIVKKIYNTYTGEEESTKKETINRAELIEEKAYYQAKIDEIDARINYIDSLK